MTENITSYQITKSADIVLFLIIIICFVKIMNINIDREKILRINDLLWVSAGAWVFVKGSVFAYNDLPMFVEYFASFSCK